LRLAQEHGGRTPALQAKCFEFKPQSHKERKEGRKERKEGRKEERKEGRKKERKKERIALWYEVLILI
jgi:hypothetical protein